MHHLIAFCSQTLQVLKQCGTSFPDDVLLDVFLKADTNKDGRPTLTLP